MSVQVVSTSRIGAILRLLSTASLPDAVRDSELEVAAIDSIAQALVSSWGVKDTMHSGDSLMTGSNAAPGGSRIAFQSTLRSRGATIRSRGPVVAGKIGFPAPYIPNCAGYPGTTLVQALGFYQPSGVIGTYLRNVGIPDITFARWGGNDVSIGTTLALLQSNSLALWDAMDRALGPQTFKVWETLSNFYPPATPSGGLAAANALIAQYNASLDSLLAQRPGWSLLHTGELIQQADVNTVDGAHWLPCGHSKVGVIEADEFSRIFPITYGQQMPRPFVMRAKQASAKFTTKTTDQIIFGADNGWRLGPSNFLACCRINPTSLTNAIDVTAILQSTPAGQNYFHGFLLAYDSNQPTPTLNVYLNGNGIPFVTPIAAAAGSLYWLFVHGDWNQGVVSVWMGIPTSPTAPGAPFIVACVAMALGVTRWTLADANPVMTAGANASIAGFAGSIDSIGWAQGSNVPGFDDIGPVLEDMLYNGRLPQGLTAYARVDEGIGVNVASAMGGASGTLTGGWSAAGTLAWPSDQ